ncbi:hypothetical protein ATANTOWER_012356, partial [Ataeniobius toweri]|nr:hypothetical protein [Ataeniobius toweri]
DFIESYSQRTEDLLKRSFLRSGSRNLLLKELLRAPKAAKSCPSSHSGQSLPSSSPLLGSMIGTMRVEFTCSPRACVASLWVLQLPPTVQNKTGSIISSPHMRQRTPSGRDCPSRHSGQSLPSSSSLLGSLFGTRRVKSPSPTPQTPHPTLISHTPHPVNLHHTARVETDTPVPLHPHHAQFCHVTQNPPPYHHHHHYHPPPHLQHPPHQYHPPPSHSQQPPYPPHPQHSHGNHSAHSPHLHGQPPPPSQVPSSTKPKHSGISTVV